MYVHRGYTQIFNHGRCNFGTTHSQHFGICLTSLLALIHINLIHKQLLSIIPIIILKSACQEVNEKAFPHKNTHIYLHKYTRRAQESKAKLLPAAGLRQLYMHVCGYVFMHACMYVCIYLYVCTYTNTKICKCTQRSREKSEAVSISRDELRLVYAHACILMCKRTHKYIFYAYIYVIHIHVYIHKRICIFTYIYI